MPSFGLDEQEHEQLKTAGYLVRESIFDTAETMQIASLCEQVVQRVAHSKENLYLDMGHYVFEIDKKLEVVIKWERENPEVLLGLEPVAHLSPDLRHWALDSRLTGPAADLIGHSEVCLYTEKLNLKKSRFGGPIVTHQDHPYWVDVADDVDKIATAVVFLDDASLANGCIEVLPGSHLGGLQKGKNTSGFGSNEMDTSDLDQSGFIPLEVPAGSAAFFGPRLVHRSLHNHSNQDRRAILFSYQPFGFRHSRHFVRLDKIPTDRKQSR